LVTHSSVFSVASCNAFDEQYEPPYPNLPNFASVKEVFLDLLSQQDSPKILPTALDRYLSFVQINSLGRSFMKTQEGYLGLAPAAAQERDQVCIILGSDAPWVLRPAGQRRVAGSWTMPCHRNRRRQGISRSASKFRIDIDTYFALMRLRETGVGLTRTTRQAACLSTTQD
jgi:hypothetical protein